MSRHLVHLVVEVDDEALAEHDGNKKPPPNDVHEWEARDLADAADLEIVDLGESALEYQEELTD